jgi:hypothetical protein
MKTMIFFRFLLLLMASAVIISCSKEKFTPVNANETNNISVSKAYPVPYNGGIAGTLTPAPYYAAIKFYHEDGNFVASCLAEQTGFFKSVTLIPGIYRIMIAYIPYTSGNYPDRDEYKYFEIRGVNVEYGVLTKLGDILLPK